MKAKSALITGIAGFVGSWLAEELLNNGYEVTGTVFPDESQKNIAAIRKHLKLSQLDILDRTRCRTIVRRYQPDLIFHLAAFSSVGQSFNNERLAYRVNFEGTLNMLEAAIKFGLSDRFVFVSSADCYGNFKPVNKTLTEKQSLNPVSPYGLSKAAAEHIVLFYQRRYGLNTVVARSFNHSGPRQSDSFVIPTFARQIATVEAGMQRPLLKVGDLSARRDFSDVRDIVRGYRLLAENGKAGEVYQFCSGRSVTIKHVLDKLVGQAKKKIRISQNKKAFRPNDIPVLRGSNRKAVQELGYGARYSLRTTLRDTLDYWRDRIGK